MHILVVDDKPSVLTSVSNILTEQGHTFETASNGLAALEKAHSNTYDLFIIDHLMPVMNGLQLSKNLNQDTTLKTKPIIFMTTQGKSVVEKSSTAYCFAAIIEKPIVKMQLCDLINNISPQNTLVHSL